MDILEQIDALFHRHGDRCIGDEGGLPLTARAHALQCAQLAEWDDAPPALVAAALLHDIGHFIEAPRSAGQVDDAHEMKALGLLAAAFEHAVFEPVRLHVQAKRYLVSTDASYLGMLAPSARRSLALQGGAMSREEVARFESLPFGPMAVSLRRWDDRARQAGRRTPSLDYYLGIVAAARQRPAPRLQLVSIGALDVA